MFIEAIGSLGFDTMTFLADGGCYEYVARRHSNCQNIYIYITLQAEAALPHTVY